MSLDKILVTSITINTAKIKALVQFYRALGLPLESKQVTLGSEIYRAQLGSIEFCLFGVGHKEKSLTPPLQLSFKVKDLLTTVNKVSELANVTVMMEPTEMPDGKKAIILDPEGHAVELLQN